MKGIVVSSQITEAATIAWHSGPRFREERDALTAYGWLVELGEASHHLLFEYARAYRLGPWQLPDVASGAPRRPPVIDKS